MVSIENSVLSVQIDLHGGTLHGVTDKRTGEQLLWQGGENSWTSRDVVIFPFVARLKDKRYTVDGREYSMENHGLARYNDFTVTEKKPDSVTLGFVSDQRTLLRYPWKFAFYVSYKLSGNALTVTMRAENHSENVMYFALGGHPAYRVPFEATEMCDDITGNFIEFENTQQPVRYLLNDTGAYITGVTAKETVKKLPLSKELFQTCNTLIFGGIEGVLTLSKKDGSNIVFDIGKPPYLAFWTHPKRGGYICVEPWWGLPDFMDGPSELKDKTGINALKSGGSFEYAYTAVYND